jgi:signal transduction histidine kinase
METRKGRIDLEVQRAYVFGARLVKPYVLYLLFISVVGLLLALHGFSQVLLTREYLIFILLLALAIGVQFSATSIPIGKSAGITYAIVPAITLAIVPFYGPAAAALAEAVSAAALWLTKPANDSTWKKSLPQLAFNMGMGSISIYIAGWVLLETQSLLGANTLAGIVLPWILAAVVNDQLNLWLLIGILTLQNNPRPNPILIWKQNVWAMPIGVLTMSVGGATLTFAVTRFDWVGVVIFFLPILLSSYADHVYVRQMRHHMKHLEEIVAERTKELEDLMREKDAFLAVLTHDMKSPLTTIGLYAQLIKKQPDLLKDRPGISDVLLQSQETLTEIVNNILDIEELQSGHVMPLKRETFELGPLLEWLAESVAPQAQSKEISFQLDAELFPIVMTADRRHLERIFSNLFSNAIKYTPDGGKVCVTARQVQYDALVNVEDTGYGIPAEELPYIFQPFRRVLKHKDKARGTGLGLAITKALVEAHGGEISVSSAEEQGSTFTVRLPLRTER